MEGGRLAGSCDSGYSCAYTQSISWRSPTEPIAKEHHVRAVFTRLFGEPDLERRRAQEERQRRTLEVLDAIGEERRALLRQLGRGADRDRLDEYFESIRSVERRLQKDQDDPERFRVPDDVQERLGASGYADRLDLMYDLIVLALQADRTRVVSFMVANAGSNRSYRFLGVDEGHHSVSHHGTQADKVDAYRKVHRFHVERFARFLGRCAEARIGEDRRLLDASTIVFGSGLSDGNRHNHEDLPILVAGRAGGALRPAGHVRHADETPLANLYTTLLRVYGVGQDRFADATGALEV
jgi:hypothetical protein